MKLFVALALGVLFTLIACYVESQSIFSYRNLLLFLVYGIASFALVSSVNISTARDVLMGVVSFLLVAAVFRGLLVLYSLSGQRLAVNWLMAIFFWIIFSGIVMERFIKKAA